MSQNWDKMGEHLLLDVYDGYFDDLNSPNFLRDIFTRAILKSEMTILNEYTHKFSPCGVTCLFALSESCLLYTSPSPRDVEESRMPSSA